MDAIDTSKDTKRYRIVTPEQYTQGYRIPRGIYIERELFSLVNRLADGNYLVIDPIQPEGEV